MSCQDTEKLRRIVRAAFIVSRFGYCPLISMSHDRNMSKKFYRIQEKALRIIYQDPVSNFDAFLHKDNSILVDIQNLELLMKFLYPLVTLFAYL